MPDILENNWTKVVGVFVLAWMGWVTTGMLSLPSSLQAIQYSLQTIQMNQNNTIPPVVEASLRELREKGNSQSSADRESLVKLQEMAINNAKDIGYLKERTSVK